MGLYEEEKDEFSKERLFEIMEELDKFYTEEFRWGKMLFNQDFPVILKKED